MFLAVLYFILRLVLRLAPDSDARDREAEILVLRHQLAVMKRKVPVHAFVVSTGCFWPLSRGS